MHIAHTIAECRELRSSLGSVAFVPTMGALHRGHTALMDEAKKHADHLAVSIFVNPTQFSPTDDLSRYPRPIERDLELSAQQGVSLVFQPSPAEMYRPSEPAVAVDVPALTGVLEGEHRPGHFAGVCAVVLKLFNIVQPCVAVFGRKDFQQLRVIEAMTAALDLPVQIIGHETVRDDDGLAMSSRNVYLSEPERTRALAIPRSLHKAAELATRGQPSAAVEQALREYLLHAGPSDVPAALQYAVCVDTKTLRSPERIESDVLLAVAMKVGNTRLIDNMLVRAG